MREIEVELMYGLRKWKREIKNGRKEKSGKG